MNKRSYRRFTTDEKRMILTEVQQPGVTLSEVCRKHSASPALASCTGAKTRIVHDHCSEFCNAELRAVIKAHDLIDIRTRARHPESNGIVERWNGTVRRESEDYYGDNYLAAPAPLGAAARRGKIASHSPARRGAAASQPALR
jgi:transposase InsO family protein